MEIEIQEREIPFESQNRLRIKYKERLLSKEYVADMICYSKIIVEFKALDVLNSRDDSQVLNYLKATGMRVGVLINFGSQGKMEWKRLVL